MIGGDEPPQPATTRGPPVRSRGRWFLDAPASIRRWRESVTEIAGFSRTSGFVDDTRALCSIPARHDMARRVDAGFLAGLVAEHRLDEAEAAETLADLVTGQPTRVFRL